MNVLLVHRHNRVEIGLHLEDLPEIIVQMIEQVVEVIGSDNDHVHLDFDGLRLHGRGSQKVERIISTDLHLPVF
jgi:hypothetical protein